MIKTITASLLFAASLSQAPPQTVPEVPPQAQAVPQTPEYVPSNPAAPNAATTVAPGTTVANGLPLLPPGEFYGAFGQICVPDPLKDVTCQQAGALATPQYPGFMKCERGYDCCLCGSVSCGTYWEGCNTFSAGDSGVKGVQDIHIIGRNEQLGGGDILCIGIEACTRAKILGERIKNVDAAGALSLRDAEVIIKNPIADFNVDCVGLGSCENLRLEILIEGPPEGYQCNPAVDPQVIEFNAIQCAGVQACSGATFVINNQGCDIIEIQQIECILGSSCMGTHFEFTGAVEVNNCDIRGGNLPTGLEAACGIPGNGNPGQGPPAGNWIPI